MKLLSKLTLYSTVSKTAIVLLFIWLLPGLVNDVAFRYTNAALQEQKKKVIDVIGKNGIDYYFQGDSSYGSYTMLKEEYISLDKAGSEAVKDTIETSRRIVETDTLTYRVLTHVFEYNHKKYVLEIGKTITSINQYNRPLQKVALYVLIGLVVVTLVFDLIFTRVLLRPLGVIIRTKLLNRKFPFKENVLPVKTSTSDFRFLDNSLVELMDKIREAFEKEKEFTSNASHELMTPISILQNKMENFLDAELPEALQEKVMGMMQTLSRLKKIVRSLLLISRIENDQFARSASVNMLQLATEVVAELEERFEAKAVTKQLHISKDIAIPNVNHDLLFQLVYNLVSNAVRYNKENGEVVISGSYQPDGKFILEVKDNGVGIPATALTGIFDRFKKSAGTNEENYGLGLSIVKSIAQYHNWHIKVVSEVGTGTVFSIYGYCF